MSKIMNQKAEYAIKMKDSPRFHPSTLNKGSRAKALI